MVPSRSRVRWREICASGLCEAVGFAMMSVEKKAVRGQLGQIR